MTIRIPQPVFGWLTNIGVVLPYIVSLLLIGLMFFYYANFIQTSSVRKLAKIVLVVFLLFSVWSVAGEDILEEIYGEEPTETETTAPVTTTSATSSSAPTTSTNDTTAIETSTDTGGTHSTTSGELSEVLAEGLELFTNSLVFFFLGLLLLGLTLFRLQSRRPPPDIESRLVKDKESREYRSTDKTRERIIGEYLQVSKLLETQGANSDYSLTPKEFESDVQTRFADISSFDDLTDLYEVARFSNTPIPEDVVERAVRFSEAVKTRFLERQKAEDNPQNDSAEVGQMTEEDRSSGGDMTDGN